jgi:membrane fusion protein (multidrug efflux system)
MKDKRVTWFSLLALVVVAVVGYFGHDWLDGGGVVGQNRAAQGAAKAPDSKASEGKTAEAKSGDTKAAAGKGGTGPVPVNVLVVSPGHVQEDLQAVGSLQSNESVVLRPEVAGRIAQIAFKDGQGVKRGQLLVALDSTVNAAEVAKARAEWELARSNQKRADDLASKNFISSSAQEQAASNVQVLEANVKLAEARLSKMRIVAPFDGVVGIRNVSVGDYVKDGADLINIEEVRTLKVDFRLPERYLTQVRVGQAVDVVADALPGKSFRGALDAINPRVEANGRSLEVRARLDNSSGALRPGMFVRVRVIIGERNDALMVPEEAIVPSGDDFFVFRVIEREGQTIAQRVRVRPGVRREAKVEITEGLASGDRIVTAGMRLARDGQLVRVLSVASGEARPAGDKAGPAAAAMNTTTAK